MVWVRLIHIFSLLRRTDSLQLQCASIQGNAYVRNGRIGRIGRIGKIGKIEVLAHRSVKLMGFDCGSVTIESLFGTFLVSPTYTEYHIGLSCKISDTLCYIEVVQVVWWLALVI